MSFNLEQFAKRIKDVNGLVGAQIEHTFVHAETDRLLTLGVDSKHSFLFDKLIIHKRKVRSYLAQFWSQDLDVQFVLVDKDGNVVREEVEPKVNESTPSSPEEVRTTVPQSRDLELIAAWFPEVQAFKNYLAEARSRLESPIETQLFEALILRAAGKVKLNVTSGLSLPDTLTITPQQEFTIRRAVYRADFVVTLNGRSIAVECDGHDFHERTKEQATRDKKRDRAFASLGISVLRFTGTEIFNNADNCAKEILEILGTTR